MTDGGGVFRGSFTLNATLFLWVIFMLKNLDDLPTTHHIGQWVWPFILISIPFGLSRLSIFLVPKLGSDRIKKGGIIRLTHADSTFLPSYLGYFFVALSVDSYHTMYFVYGIVFIFSLSSQNTYFNPVFLLRGYKFYSMETETGATLFLISKKSYRNPLDMDDFNVFRINDYTLMEP